eukprot:5561964-Lingulodinium_polyedra.AAC.1
MLALEPSSVRNALSNFKDQWQEDWEWGSNAAAKVLSVTLRWPGLRPWWCVPCRGGRAYQRLFGIS